MNFVLSLDQGTTSSRAILFDRGGQVVAVAQKEFRQFFPSPGLVEHDANEIWATQAGVAAEVLGRAGIDANQVAAVGIANQRETTVVWDRNTGDPIAPAIVWQDRRTAEFCDRLKEDGLEERIRARTGLVLDPYFSGTKLRWILENVDDARPRAEAGDLCFGTIDSWLAFKLTEGEHHVTDVSNASRTLLFDIHTLDWSDELLEVFDIPRAMLPKVCSSSETIGEIKSGIVAEGAMLSGIAGDQQAALMGQGCWIPGHAKNTYGTGCFLLMNTGDSAPASKNRLLTTLAWRRGEEVSYALEGSVFVGGAIVQWLRDGLGIIQNSTEVEALAASVQDNGGVYFVPALTGLGAPHWDSYARGAILGMTRGTTRAHIARAALEGIAFQVADVVSAMESDSNSTLSELRVDGGAAANDFLLQFQADILQVPVARPTVLESTARGAAFLAGLATGFWESLDDLSSICEVDCRFDPQMPHSRASELRQRWADAVGRASRWES